jgi:hypothetical protein
MELLIPIVCATYVIAGVWLAIKIDSQHKTSATQKTMRAVQEIFFWSFPTTLIFLAGWPFWMFLYWWLGDDDSRVSTDDQKHEKRDK